MSTITIKDIPPDIHRSLKSQAKSHGRSLNREIITVLENAVHGALISAAPTAEHARSVRESMGVYLTQRELTERKDAGRR